jgi:hypothetical protein
MKLSEPEGNVKKRIETRMIVTHSIGLRHGGKFRHSHRTSRNSVLRGERGPWVLKLVKKNNGKGDST